AGRNRWGQIGYAHHPGVNRRAAYQDRREDWPERPSTPSQEVRAKAGQNRDRERARDQKAAWNRVLGEDRQPMMQRPWIPGAWIADSQDKEESGRNQPRQRPAGREQGPDCGKRHG